MKKSSSVLTLIALFSIWSFCTGQTSQTIAQAGDQPSIASNPQGTLGITYGSGKDIYFSFSNDNGETFSQPELVANSPGLILGMSSGPQLSMSSDFYTVIAPDRQGNLTAWRKASNGDSWEGPFRINDVNGAAGENLAALTYDSQGTLFATWIDTRRPQNEHAEMGHDKPSGGHEVKDTEAGEGHEKVEKKREQPETSHDMPVPLTPEQLKKEVGEMPAGAKGISQYQAADGKMYWVVLDENGKALKAKDMESYKRFKAQNAGRRKPEGKIFISKSTDGGKTWSKSEFIYASPDGSVCECCKPSLINDGENIYLMFRNNVKGNRDLYLTQSRSQNKAFSTPEKLGQGSWAINGCPMDGGDLAIANGMPVTVWQRKGQVFAASPGQRELLLGQGRSPTVAVTTQGNYYFWNSRGTIQAKIPTSPMQMNLGKGSSFKVITLPNGQGVLGVWVDEGKIKAQRVG